MPFQLRLLAIVGLIFATSLAASAGTPDTSGTSTTGTSDFWTQPKLAGDLDGFRPLMQKYGLTMGLDWVAQGFANFDGGIHRGTTAASTVDLKFTLDTQTLAGWPGGTFYLDLQDHAGPDPSRNLVGDAQEFTGWNSRPFFHADEFWYQQTLFNNLVRVKVGKTDANDDFNYVDNSQSFLASSAQNSTTIFILPTYPLPATCAEILVTPTHLPYFSIGAFDTEQSDKFLDFTGASQDSIFPKNGLFIIGETGLIWKHLASWQADGNLRLGAWDDTGTFAKLNGGETHGTKGFYCVFDQTLWKPDWDASETRGVRMFMEYGETPGDVSLIDKQFGGGFTWTGLSPDRPGDIIGIGPEYVNLSDKAGLPKPFELAIEAFYQYQVAPWVNIQPDLQYICHPGGVYSNALVATLQLTVHF